MHKHCAPCAVHYHYVGKLETLTADADVILTAAGVKVSELTPGEESLSASSELTALTDLVGKFFVGGNAKTGSSDTYRCQVNFGQRGEGVGGGGGEMWQREEGLRAGGGGGRWEIGGGGG